MTFGKFQDYFELLKGELADSVTSPIYSEVSHSPNTSQKYFIKPQKLLLIGQNQVTYIIYLQQPNTQIIIGSNSSYFSKPKRDNINHVIIDDATHFMLSENHLRSMIH